MSILLVVSREKMVLSVVSNLSPVRINIIWALTRENLSSGILTASGSNQSAQLHRLLRIFKF